MLASPGAWAVVITPQTGVFNVTITANSLTTVAGYNVFGTYGAGTATGDTGSGFPGVTNATPAGYSINPGFALDQTASGESQTTSALNLYYNYAGTGNPIVFNGGLAGLQGTTSTIVGHAAITGGALQAASLSGILTLANPGPDTGSAALAFFNAVNTLTNGSDQLAFSGTGSGTQTGAAGSVSFVPILAQTSVLSANTPATASLLGGAGLAGGVTVTLTNPTTTGNLSASVLPYTAQQVANLENPAGAALLGSLNLAVLAPSGAAQVWNVSYSGSNPGTPITLTFTYDPKLFGANFDPTTIEVGHISTIDGSLEVLTPTSVDPVTDTITVQDTTGFSDFVLLAPIPEPSTALLMGTGIASLAFARRRRV